MNNIPLYGYTSLAYHSLDDGYLECFYFLAIVNTANINICVYVFAWRYVFMCLGYTPRSEIVGSCDNFVFNTLRTSQEFPTVAIPFNSHPSGCTVVSYCSFDLHFSNDQ